MIWHYGEIRRSISTGALADGILYYADFSGFLHALDATTGKQIWKHDMLAAVWASPLVADGKVYLGDEDGDLVVLKHGKVKEVMFEGNLGSSVYGTVVAANGALFVTNRNQLLCLVGAPSPPALGDHGGTAKPPRVRGRDREAATTLPRKP